MCYVVTGALRMNVLKDFGVIWLGYCNPGSNKYDTCVIAARINVERGPADQLIRQLDTCAACFVREAKYL